jgi:hypothetical protein
MINNKINFASNDLAEVHFSVKVRDLENLDRVVLLGDNVAMGAWNFDKGIVMREDEDVPLVWKATVQIPKSAELVHYRYVVSTPVECCCSSPDDHIVWRIKNWESYRKARQKIVPGNEA